MFKKAVAYLTKLKDACFPLQERKKLFSVEEDYIEDVEDVFQEYEDRFQKYMETKEMFLEFNEHELKAKVRGKVIAAFAGTGKTTLAAMYPESFVDFVCMPYKYYLGPEVGRDEAEAGKADPNREMRLDWPYNYVLAIIAKAVESEKTLLIPSDSGVLSLLKEKNVPYTLCYPERNVKEVYRNRFLDRGNSEHFLNVFVGGWNRFMDRLEQDDYGIRIMMSPHQFLSDVIAAPHGSCE